MSSSNNKKRSVRFTESTIASPPTKRHRPDINGDINDDEDRKPAAASIRPSKYKPKSKKWTNEDELDDIDDWNEQEDGDDQLDADNLPSESQLIEAKRQRRQKRFVDDTGEKDGTHIDSITSLASDGIQIEPFHMKQEETDGTGYFDGDTYVFRNKTEGQDIDDEPDAWADSLRDEDGNPTTDIARISQKVSSTTKSSTQEDLDDWTEVQLYERILPLVSDSETIAKAIRRYGQLVKQHHNQKRKNKHSLTQSTNNTSTTEDVDSNNMAKKCLDDLTGAANALLLQGEVDIYDTTREQILRKFNSELANNSNAKASTTTTTNTAASTPKNIQWEYMGNQDHQIHGPYTTEQMIGWVKAGYFVGTQRVKIRTINLQQGEEVHKDHEPATSKLSTEDDLMADLMDDDDENENENDDDEEEPATKKRKTTSGEPIKGEWMWSNEVNYQQYL